MILRILTNTPLWVWAVLAITLTLGIRALRPQSLRWQRLIVLPAIATLWSLWRIVGGSGAGALLAVWALAGAIGFAGAGWWARNLRIDVQADGTMRVPGTRFWLAFGLTIFSLSYAANVMLALDRTLAASAWALAPTALAGFAIGFAWGWVDGLRRRASA